MPDIRKARMTNEEIAMRAQGHRHAASQEAAMSWPENSHDYAVMQEALAEVFEELLDRRAASGEPRT